MRPWEDQESFGGLLVSWCHHETKNLLVVSWSCGSTTRPQDQETGGCLRILPWDHKKTRSLLVVSWSLGATTRPQDHKTGVGSYSVTMRPRCSAAVRLAALQYLLESCNIARSCSIAVNQYWTYNSTYNIPQCIERIFSLFDFQWIIRFHIKLDPPSCSIQMTSLDVNRWKD